MMNNYQIPRAPVLTGKEKEDQRAEIQRDIDAFLANGGKIVVYPPGFSAEDAGSNNGWEKKLRNDPER